MSICALFTDADTVLLLTPEFALASPLWKQAWSNWNFTQRVEWSIFAVNYLFP